jgi:hypothetical protein
VQIEGREFEPQNGPNSAEITTMMGSTAISGVTFVVGTPLMAATLGVFGLALAGAMYYARTHSCSGSVGHLEYDPAANFLLRVNRNILQQGRPRERQADAGASVRQEACSSRRPGGPRPCSPRDRAYSLVGGARKDRSGCDRSRCGGPGGKCGPLEAGRGRRLLIVFSNRFFFLV